MIYCKAQGYLLCEPEAVQTDIRYYQDIIHPFFEILSTGLVIGNPGYNFAPSGPTIDTKTFMRGALIHDILYQAMRLKLLPLYYRKEADLELYKICQTDNMCEFRANYILWGVQHFGEPFAVVPRKIYEVP